MSSSALSKTFAVSTVVHAGVLGLLVLLASKSPVISDVPIRVRILEPPAPREVPQPPPSVGAPPKMDRPSGEGQRQASRGEVESGNRSSSKPLQSREPSTRVVPESPSTGSGSRAQPRDREGPVATDSQPTKSESAARTPGSSEVTRAPEPPAPPPLPQVAARPSPGTTMLPAERTPEPPRDAPAAAPSERSGLFLGGPSQGARSLPPQMGVPPGSGTARPSLRDQIASLGSGLQGETDATAKRTVNLDSREPQFVSYLARLKRRIEREWMYPEEARTHGISGELLLIFTLNKAGTLTNIHLVQSSGFPILDEEALRAVKAAAPYDPFPPHLGEDPWNISASFHYNMPYRFRRY